MLKWFDNGAWFSHKSFLFCFTTWRQLIFQQLLHVFMFVRIVISQETDLYHNILKVQDWTYLKKIVHKMIEIWRFAFCFGIRDTFRYMRINMNMDITRSCFTVQLTSQCLPFTTLSAFEFVLTRHSI